MPHQLTMQEREILSQMRYAGVGPVKIAKRLGRDRTTIWRELKRNSTTDGYAAVAAQQKALARRRDRPLLRQDGTARDP